MYLYNLHLYASFKYKIVMKNHFSFAITNFFTDNFKRYTSIQLQFTYDGKTLAETYGQKFEKLLF